MINKEEIEKAKRKIKTITRMYNFLTMHYDKKELTKTINSEEIEAIQTVMKYITELEKELDITKCNYEILQGEMDRIGIDALKLEPGNSTDDVIEEIEKLQKELEHYKNILAGKSIQEMGVSNLYGGGREE